MEQLLEREHQSMGLRLVCGEQGLHRYIDHPRIQKPSLAFAGFLNHLHDYRLQVIGKTEIDYLATLTDARQREVIDATFALRLAGVVITNGITPPDSILHAATTTDTPLMVSNMGSDSFITDMSLFLAHQLAPSTYQHGVYMDIFGLGVLLLGDSGIGKSEIGLELLARGHRLIADDIVELVHEGADILVGRSPETLRDHMEIRGMGILNVRHLFGAASLTRTKRVNLAVEFIPWDAISDEERLLSHDDQIELHGIAIPRTRLPIRPGRSMAILVEVATRNQLLKLNGTDSNQMFVEQLQQRIQAQTQAQSQANSGENS